MHMILHQDHALVEGPCLRRPYHFSQESEPPQNPGLFTRLNVDLKWAIGSKVPARTKAKLRGAATQYMIELEGSPERVKAFFRHKHVCYAV